MKNHKVIFEDESILVVDKPAGLVVDRSSTNQEETLQDWLEKNYQFPITLPYRQAGNYQANKEFFDRSGIVHRLDKETSGLLVIAKNPIAFDNLQRQFKQRLVRKKYLALVHGRVNPKSGEIVAPISRSSFNRKKFGVFLGGRESKTSFNTLSNYSFKGEYFTLLELSPATGRTHQLRVHLKHLSYPVVGDVKYAGRKTSRNDRQWCPRQFLHASKLSFIHPASANELKFVSPLPEDLKKVLDFLGSRLYSPRLSH